jgi:hypothetical protein
MLSPAPPLLEEKSDATRLALVTDISHPVSINRSRMMTTFTSDDHPVDTTEIDRREALKERFDRQEAHSRIRLPEV